MFTMIAAALGLIGTLAGIAWKWKAANSSSAADKAATTEAVDANAMTKTSAGITDATRTTTQEKLDANQAATSRLVDAINANGSAGNGDASADGLQSGADALNTAIADANRSKN